MSARYCGPHAGQKYFLLKIFSPCLAPSGSGLATGSHPGLTRLAVPSAVALRNPRSGRFWRTDAARPTFRKIRMNRIISECTP